MKIAYRRMSGSVGLSGNEPGTRGAWVEKRVAFLAELSRRGHSVDILGKLSKASGGHTLGESPPYDLLFVEFGSSNKQFHGAALLETAAIVARHKGPKVFLCDDPDLDFTWDLVPSKKDWFVWHNATSCLPLAKQPSGVPTFDFPFSVFQSQLPISEQKNPFVGPLVYIGRPGGRAKVFKALTTAQVTFVAYANASEWKEFSSVVVMDPPTQSERAAFYNSSLGCLAVADAKHKHLGWRTGRAFHALAAGCPVIAEADHPGMGGFATFKYGYERNANEWIAKVRDPDYRGGVVGAQRRIIANRDLPIAEATFKAFNL